MGAASIQRNIKLFKIDAFFGGSWPLCALAVVYFEQITHSYALAMLVWSISSLTQTFTEVPTGIFSDKIGRRKTVILAAYSVLTAILLWALAGQLECMWLLFIGAVFWGLCDSLISGTLDALMYETMEELNQKENFPIFYAQTNFWNQFGLAVSTLFAAGITYFFSLQILAWLSVFTMVGQLVTAYLFVEPKRITEQRKTTSMVHFFIAFRRLWRNKKLRFYAGFTLLNESVGEAYTQIVAAYFQTLIKEWLINIMRFIKQVSGMIGFAFVPYVRRFGTVRLFFTSVTMNEVLKTIGLILNNAFSPFIMSLVNFCWGISSTAKTDILQQEFSPNQRATMQSIIEVVKGIMAAIVMYLFGVLADISGPRMAIVATVVIKIILLVGSFMILRRKKV